MSDQRKKRCFIITPIGNDTDPIRRHIEGIIDAAILPALGGKYEIVVAHKIADPGSITKQIITEIYHDELVIANLTNKNPNVMYELAFRHSLGKPVIMIAEKGTSLPSDIIMERTIFYQNDARGTIELREELKRAEESIRFDLVSSPIHDVIHEIDAAAKIIETSRKGTVDSGDTGDGAMFKFILEKLDGIENKVQAMRSVQPARKPLERRKFTFSASYIPVDLGPTELFEKAKGISAFDANVKVDDVHIDPVGKRITVFVTLFGRINTFEILDYFSAVFEVSGVKDAKHLMVAT